MVAWLTITLVAVPASANASDTADPFVHPPELETDIRFWIRVYTEVTTDGGLLHDDWNLGLVYEALRFDPADSPAQREREVTRAKARYADMLRRFAARADARAAAARPGASQPNASQPDASQPDASVAGAKPPAPGAADGLTAHERRILHAFGDEATAADFRDAIERIRFQLGQADRFHEGLIRSQLFERNISRVLAQRGVPAEIGALPHVESSFNPAAYSRVGAAGLWQFMPSTAKRFMRVDSVVDERLDPYTATEAAANLMLYNYRLLGSWPLAVTAYNHGPGGLRRAQDELGTSNIAVIVKRYQGATFGFASRNFYVAFLAALEIDRNAEKYFGPLTHLPETQSTVVELPDYIPIEALAKAFKADIGALRVLNPALRPPIWSGARFVPRGYGLRLPGAEDATEISAGWARLPSAQRYLAQRNDGAHKLRRGETLAGLAAASGVPLSRLLAVNGWNAGHEVARGDVVHLPLPASRADSGASTAAAPPSSVSAPEASAAGGSPAVPPVIPAPAAPAQASASQPSEPISERQAGTALLPAVSPTGNSDTTDYGVGPGDTVIVQAAETLGHLADWSKSSGAALRALNKLRPNAVVTLGRRVKLDLSRVSAAEFVEARRAYHRQLQDAFFATHRIAGTDSYAVKPGESLWMIAQRHGDLPVWLVTQYNPDVHFGDVRPGTSLALPRITAVNRQ